jgi:hypothetical protein
MIFMAETLCILIGMLPLMAGYYESGLSLIAIGCFIVGLFWLLSQWRKWAWVASLGLFCFVSAAGIGIWFGLSPVMMVFSVLGNLLAWDLADFSRRLQDAAPDDDLQKLENNHLVRLASLGTISLALTLTALLLHLRISFGWMMLLTVVAIFGMMQLVNRVRRGG